MAGAPFQINKIQWIVSRRIRIVEIDYAFFSYTIESRGILVVEL